MAQQFTPSTDGQNAAIAAGPDPTYTVRVRGVNWRPDVMLVLSSAADLRMTQFADADTYYVRGVGEFLWDEDDTTADNGTTVFQVTGVTVGRYKMTAGSSFLAILPNGDSVAVSKIDQSLAVAPAISSGTLTLPRGIDGWWFSDLSVPPSGAWDARRGVSVTGSDVDSVADITGCGATATQTSTNRPTLSAAWGDGGACLNFASASSQNLRCNGVASKFAGSQARSTIACIRPAGAPAANATIFSVMSAANAFTSHMTYATTYGMVNSGSIVNTAYTASAIYAASRATVVAYVNADGAGNSHIYCDGRLIAIANDALDGTVAVGTQAAIGGNLYSGGITNFFNGDMRFVSVHNGAITGDDYKEACRQLLGGLYTRIVCDGNSLTAVGWGIYPATLQAQLGARNLGRFEVTNTAVGGQNTDAMIARYAAQVATAYSQYQNNIVVAWELSNQFVGSYSGSATIADQARAAVDKLWQYCELARATGFKIIVLTATYREAAGYVGVPSKAIGDSGIDAMNTLVRAEWQTHADALVDICADPYFQNSALVHVYDDGTHMSDPASQVVALKVARAVNRLIARF